MGSSILIASTIVAAVVCFGLFSYIVLRVTNFTSDEKAAIAKGKVSRAAWRKRSALVVGANTAVFFGLLVISIYGLQVFKERLLQANLDARQATYDACLERTSAEVCEIHWVRFPKSGSDSGSSFVISPNGKIGLGLDL